MAARRNPFKPTFGVTPPVLAGREQALADFADALDEGPGAPGRATIYTGARGSGKTVLLNAAQDLAAARGWLVIAETATPGLVRRLVEEQLPALLAEHDPEGTQSRLTGITMPAALGRVDWTSSDRHAVTAGLRGQVTALCGILAKTETGLLITVDELHRRPIDELAALCTVVQHCFREELDVAFIGAGLPSAVSEVLEAEVLTFLRRAELQHLGRVGNDDVSRALVEPIRQGGRTIADDALAQAIKASGGYPFLIQLVGHRIWRQDPGAAEITLDHALAGAEEARLRLGGLVHGVALAGCSDVDRAFLEAMAEDDGPSATRVIAERLQVTRAYANVYRTRLLEAQLIEVAGRGRVDFAIPYLREYVRERASAENAR